MICYRDMTFCVSPGCTNKCGRKLTPTIRNAAREWWGGPGAPIAQSFFCGTPDKMPTEASHELLRAYEALGVPKTQSAPASAKDGA